MANNKRQEKLKKISNIATCAVFCIFVIGLGIYAFVSPKPTYSQSEKRELSKMMRIIKKYPKSFASFSRVNEVFGNFKK